MTRKDYVLIAAAIARAEFDARQEVAHYVAKALAEDNPRFDSARFLKACAIE